MYLEGNGASEIKGIYNFLTHPILSSSFGYLEGNGLSKRVFTTFQHIQHFCGIFDTLLLTLPPIFNTFSDFTFKSPGWEELYQHIIQQY